MEVHRCVQTGEWSDGRLCRILQPVKKRVRVMKQRSHSILIWLEHHLLVYCKMGSCPCKPITKTCAGMMVLDATGLQRAMKLLGALNFRHSRGCWDKGNPRETVLAGIVPVDRRGKLSSTLPHHAAEQDYGGEQKLLLAGLRPLWPHPECMSISNCHLHHVNCPCLMCRQQMHAGAPTLEPEKNHMMTACIRNTCKKHVCEGV